MTCNSCLMQTGAALFGAASSNNRGKAAVSASVLLSCAPLIKC